MSRIADLKIKLFADGADKAGMLKMYEKDYIQGFTTNPTLMRKAGIEDYSSFAKEMLSLIKDRPISFEVFADELDEMEEQAYEIASWGSNVFVKIPVTNTKGVSTTPIIKILSAAKVPLNITAVFTVEQASKIIEVISEGVPAIISVFAGRIADTGIDPLPIMQEILEKIKGKPHIELLWASPRELLNVIQANDMGCHIITATNDILQKLTLLDKDLTEFSLETVRMFYNDAAAAGYLINQENCLIA